jgi:hypothetical protein
LADKDDFFSELEAEASKASELPATTTVTLDQVHSMGREAANLQRRIETGEKLISQLKQDRYKLLNETMPQAMDELKVKKIDVDGYVLSVGPYFKAAIKVDDPEEQRERAFQWVEKEGGGDIIKSQVVVDFPKEMLDRAEELALELTKRYHNYESISVTVARSVPWATLTSWLKGWWESPPKKGKKKSPIPLEDLNATVGRVVAIKGSRD